MWSSVCAHEAAIVSGMHGEEVNVDVVYHAESQLLEAAKAAWMHDEGLIVDDWSCCILIQGLKLLM